MNVSVILAHLYKKSFNYAIASTVKDALICNGYNVFYHDLHDENFDPILQPEELITEKSDDKLLNIHWEEIKITDGLIIIHPNWWGRASCNFKRLGRLYAKAWCGISV